MTIETESHEFMGWYEGFHARDEQVDRLTAQHESDAKVIAELREELQEIYNALDLGGNFSAVDEIKKLRNEQTAGEGK